MQGKAKVSNGSFPFLLRSYSLELPLYINQSRQAARFPLATGESASNTCLFLLRCAGVCGGVCLCPPSYLICLQEYEVLYFQHQIWRVFLRVQLNFIFLI